MEPDDLTLADAIKTAFVKSALECSSLLSPVEHTPLLVLAQQFQFTDHMTSLEVSPATDSSVPVLQMGRQHPSLGPRCNCGNCGYNSHATRAPQCPAHVHTCQNCSRINHFVQF